MATDVHGTQSEEARAERTRTGNWFRPLVDIVEKKDELLLIADLPGANSDSIDIHFEDGVLTVEGSVAPRYEPSMNFMLAEYGVGNFHRSFRVSEHVDASRIHAEYENGVLTIHLPKAEQAKPRKIQVQATS
jgi:HSP20 family protein